MVYGVCLKCSHTRELREEWVKGESRWFGKCFSCGGPQVFRIVRQIEQPDGSVIEVTA
jgi:hypothetical protein